MVCLTHQACLRKCLLMQKRLRLAKKLLKDDVFKDFILHFRIWRDEFGFNEEKEEAYDKYCQYIKKLSAFSLDLFYDIVNSQCAGTEKSITYIENTIGSYLAETANSRKCHRSFQQRILTDLKKIGKVIIY